MFLIDPFLQQAFGAAAAPFSAAGRNARMGVKPPPPLKLDTDFDMFDEGELFKVREKEEEKEKNSKRLAKKGRVNLSNPCTFLELVFLYSIFFHGKKT